VRLAARPILPVVSGAPQAALQQTAALECVVNVSEGCDQHAIDAIGGAAGRSLLDVHSDCDHHRSVFTLVAADVAAQGAVRALARAAVERLDLRDHVGAHPRIGVLDVVPWVALDGWPLHDAGQGASGRRAMVARDEFAGWASSELGLPVFLYGLERSLPEVRKRAWVSLAPDLGPLAPHPTAGAVAVGYRPLMVAYNLWLAGTDLAKAKAVAKALRSPEVRALAFPLGDAVQVSCNLLRPLVVGPAEIWDKVAAMATVRRAELVGLVPQAVLARIPVARWRELDLGPDKTIEARVAKSQKEEWITEP
jgi:glutamate formiminotransferase / 5-formyltetrahydrofolate cyclo-ligase